jgi:hypothetical protein
MSGGKYLVHTTLSWSSLPPSIHTLRHLYNLITSLLGLCLLVRSIFFDTFSPASVLSPPRIKMLNLFTSLTLRTAQDSKAVVKAEQVINTSLPPPYMERERLHPSTDTWGVRDQALKRCLIWRIAVDWGLKRHVPRAQIPASREYDIFERCCTVYGKLLGNHYESDKLHLVKTKLDGHVFRPGESLGIGASKSCLEFVLSPRSLFAIWVHFSIFPFLTSNSAACLY